MHTHTHTHTHILIYTYLHAHAHAHTHTHTQNTHTHTKGMCPACVGLPYYSRATCILFFRLFWYSVNQALISSIGVLSSDNFIDRSAVIWLCCVVLHARCLTLSSARAQSSQWIQSLQLERNNCTPDLTADNLYSQGATQSHQKRCKYYFDCLVFSEMYVFEYVSQRQDTRTRQIYRQSGGSQGE